MNITSSSLSSTTASLYRNDVASYVSGSVSIACWIVVLIPQLYTNYKLKSSESLSTTFLLIWFAGDALNFAGAVLQDLLLTMIVLAFYYNITDLILLCQVYYYRRYGRRPSKEDEEQIYATEETPLVPQHNHRPASIIGPSILCIVVTGLVSYYHYSAIEEDENVIGNDSVISRFSILQSPKVSPSPAMILLGQTLGWGSAVLYLGSRIPQLVMNYENQSCEGLSLSMFFFSVLGNFTYCSSILFHSVDRKFILRNLPWLIGSGGTLLFDFMIFVQFYLYRNRRAVDIKQMSEGISTLASSSSPPPSYSEI
ncbi:6771_t:CDS:2 [Ambispora gerdemannii]|uniref:6771_t:CDS:1 n=1 Tax=Ambispora gerdemannii TaxID=144530 RepID=A0A9N8YRL0_9GLOM|nr:6771_t:CDS:2 [Ambispora gerdemannii]